MEEGWGKGPGFVHFFFETLSLSSSETSLEVLFGSLLHSVKGVSHSLGIPWFGGDLCPVLSLGPWKVEILPKSWSLGGQPACLPGAPLPPLPGCLLLPQRASVCADFQGLVDLLPSQRQGGRNQPPFCAVPESSTLDPGCHFARRIN